MKSTFVILKAILSILTSISAVALNIVGYYFCIFEISIFNSVVMVLLLFMVFMRFFKGFNLLIWGFFCLYSNIFTFLVHNTANEEGYHYINQGEYTIQLFLALTMLMSILTKGSHKIRTAKSSFN